MDTAQLRFSSVSQNYTHIELWGQSTECFKCSLIPLCITDGDPPLQSYYNNISTEWPWTIQLRLGQVRDANYNIVNFTGSIKFGEHGMYTVSISDDQPPYILDDSFPVNSYPYHLCLFSIIFHNIKISTLNYCIVHTGWTCCPLACSFVVL